ncbi:MAG: hypothetical protein LBU34_09845 [Planctomycetaceae bacterium]|nr:hypothetical protein [Planctomycetaceae bacterium]
MSNDKNLPFAVRSPTFCFCIGLEIPIQRLRYASSPVMHISSLAGLKPSQAELLTQHNKLRT